MVAVSDADSGRVVVAGVVMIERRTGGSWELGTTRPGRWEVEPREGRVRREIDDDPRLGRRDASLAWFVRRRRW